MSSTTEEGIEDNTTTATTETGHDLSLSELLLQYRKTFINIDMLVISSLRECFMLLL
jgi:hypothetical protein